jgi:hypothetical protein
VQAAAGGLRALGGERVGHGVALVVHAGRQHWRYAAIARA